MKHNKLFAALVLGLAVVACQPKAQETEALEADAAAAQETVEEAVKTAKDYVASKSLKDSVAYLVGVNFGSFIKGYDFGSLSYSQIKKGMKAFIKAKGNPRDEDFGKQFKVDPNEMNSLFNRYLEMRNNEKLLANKEAGEKFLAKNKSKEGVQTSESGLQYIVLNPGNENKATSNQDTVWVRYKGTLLDGTVFDEVKPEADSVNFVLARVVKGWQEGMKLVGEGGKVRLFVPSELGYGERGPQEIGPNQTLIFDVDVCKVSPYVEPAPVEEPETK